MQENGNVGCSPCEGSRVVSWREYGWKEKHRRALCRCPAANTRSRRTLRDPPSTSIKVCPFHRFFVSKDLPKYGVKFSDLTRASSSASGGVMFPVQRSQRGLAALHYSGKIIDILLNTSDFKYHKIFSQASASIIDCLRGRHFLE